MTECAGMNPGVFQSDEPDYDEQLAKATCSRCPVAAACLQVFMTLEGAQDSRGRFGIVGGLTPSERASLDRRNRRVRPAQRGIAHVLTEGDHRRRRELWESGLTDPSAAAEVGIATSTYRDWRRKNQLGPNPRWPAVTA